MPVLSSGHTKPARLLCLLIFLFVWTPVAAQRGEKAEVKAARATPIGRTVFNNGLVLLVSEAPAEDMVAVELLVRVGIIDEKGPVSGITQVVQQVLENRIEDRDMLEASGSLIKVETEPDYARISILSTAEDFPALLDALAEEIKKREFSKDELDEVTREAIDSLEYRGGAFTQLYDIFRGRFYRYHPYRKSDAGSKLSLQRLTPATVKEYFDAYYVPNRMVLSIAGRVDRLKVVERVKTAFGDMTPGEGKWLDVPWEPKPSEKRVNLSASAEIAWLFIGWPAPSVASKDYVPMTVVNAILGEGLSSRLFNEIREKQGLAYEVGSMYPVLRGPSHLLAFVITRPNEVSKTRKTLMGEVERMRSERISQQELEDARRKVTGKYLLERETNRDRALRFAIAETIGLGYEYDQAFLRQLQEVTPEDVRRVAEQYLVNPTLIVARPGGRFYWD